MDLLRYSDYLNEKSQDAEMLEKWGILESEYLRMKEEFFDKCLQGFPASDKRHVEYNQMSLSGK